MENLETITYTWMFIFLIVGLIAGYIDSIAGGGGMIQIPVLLLTGISPIIVLASNKIAGMFGTIVASIKYAKSKKINYNIVKIAIIPCLIASYIGTLLVMYISDEFIQWMILASIPVALIFLLKKSKSKEIDNSDIGTAKIILATAPIGFYDGLIGPGTGTYMTIAMKKYLNIDYLIATASTKPLNFATNIGSAIAFLLAGKVMWAIAIPLAIGNSTGSYIGSHYAIKNGEDFIKKVLLFILFFMLLANIIKLVFFS